jgi:hypothetical protein
MLTCRVYFAQQRIGVIDRPQQDAVQDGQRKFSDHQPPKSGPHRLVSVDGSINAVNDELGNPEKPDRQQRGK